MTGQPKGLPVELMNSMNIQAYCNKLKLEENLEDEFLVMLLSAFKLIDALNFVKTTRDGFKKILGFIHEIYGFKTFDVLLDDILKHLLSLYTVKMLLYWLMMFQMKWKRSLREAANLLIILKVICLMQIKIQN